MVNGLKKIAWSSVFHFPLETEAYKYIYIPKKQLLSVCSQWKMVTAYFRLLAAKRNRKLMFVFLGRRMITVIDDCCFSKRAHLWS
jgi:hypothetical protein